MKTVLITGGGGFIAGHLAILLKQKGHRVIGVSRSTVRNAEFDKTHTAALGETLEPVLSEQPIDAIVHCANHTGADEYETNVIGTSRWFDEAKAHGVSLQILMSSLSAQADAASEYGRSKFALEQKFKSSGEVSFRLGLVVGNGGMFERMKASQRRFPIVPLLDNGSPRVYVLGIHTLCEMLCRCIESGGESMRGGIWSVQQPTPHALRDVMKSIRNHFRFRCRFLPVPSLPVLWLLMILERLPLKLPVNSTNLRGLRAGRFVEFESDFARFGLEEETLDGLVARAASEEISAREEASALLTGDHGHGRDMN